MEQQTGQKCPEEKPNQEQIPVVDMKKASAGGDNNYEGGTGGKNQPNEHTGYCEVCFAENENALQNSYDNCSKHPGHKEFIPVNEFSLEHLPERFREHLFLELVRALAAITVCLQVRCVSKHRPENFDSRNSPFPRYDQRGTKYISSGTGWIKEVIIHKLGCMCMECKKSPDATKPYATVRIVTAQHVVYDDSEANKTWCFLFFDNADRSKANLLCGFSEAIGIRSDFTEILHHTNDKDLAHQLKKSRTRFEAVERKVDEKYHCKTKDPNDTLVIIVSHPHGLNKQISIGNYIKSEQLWEFEESPDTGGLYGAFQYNAATCPGSSGAFVWELKGSINRNDSWCHSHGTEESAISRGSLRYANYLNASIEE